MPFTFSVMEALWYSLKRNPPSFKSTIIYKGVKILREKKYMDYPQE